MWKGRVMDITGDPLGGVVVRASPAGKIKPGVDGTDLVASVCDDAGRFEINGLEPGAIRVELRFPWQDKVDDSLFLPWMDVQFENPGTIEKDIDLLSGAGGFIRGNVVDEETGFPIHDQLVRVVAWNVGKLDNSESPHIYSARVHPETGSYCLRCLPRGPYCVQLNGPGSYREIRKNRVNLNAGEVAEAIDFVVPPQGKLHLVLQHFTTEDLERMTLHFISNEQQPVRHQPTVTGADRTYTLAEGDVDVEVDVDGTVGVRRSYRIMRNKTCEAVIMKSDFVPEGCGCTIKGSLKGADGTPLPHAWLVLYPDKDRYGTTLRDEMKFYATTDEKGRFSMDRVPGGRWTLSCHLGQPGVVGSFSYDQLLKSVPLPFASVYFYDVRVPVESNETRVIDPVFPSATIHGTLVDDATKGALVPGIDWIMISLLDAKNPGRPISEYRCKAGGPIELIGIPEGDYALSIIIEPPFYGQIRTRPFHVGKGKSLKMGMMNIALKGVVYLYVMDESGHYISVYDLEIEGPDGYRHSSKMDAGSDGKATLMGLRFDDLVVRIFARGFEEKEILIRPEPGVLKEVKVVLTRR